MKKILALLLTVILCFSLCTCGATKQSGTWSIKQTVDEFGDVTEESAEVITGVFTGTFSNTATAESDLSVVVHFAKKARFNHYIAGFELKEYNNTNATYISSDLKTFKIKLNDEIITMNLTGSPPNDTLYLGSEDYGWSADLVFNELLKGNDVRCIVNLGSSEYNFTLNSNNFTSLCNKNNIQAGATELTLKEALNIYLEDTGCYIGGAVEVIEKSIDKFEIMDADEVKEYFDGVFLSIPVSASQYIGDYAFPYWKYQIYSRVDKEISTYPYYISTLMQNKAAKSINSGIFASAHKTYREFETSNTQNMYYKDNLLGVEGKYEFFSPYQCRKITDDIVLLCTNYNKVDGEWLGEGVYQAIEILFKSNAAHSYDLFEFADNAVEYAQTVSIEKINY